MPNSNELRPNPDLDAVLGPLAERLEQMPGPGAFGPNLTRDMRANPLLDAILGNASAQSTDKDRDVERQRIDELGPQAERSFTEAFSRALKGALGGVQAAGGGGQFLPPALPPSGGEPPVPPTPPSAGPPAPVPQPSGSKALVPYGKRMGQAVRDVDNVIDAEFWEVGKPRSKGKGGGRSGNIFGGLKGAYDATMAGMTNPSELGSIGDFSKALGSLGSMLPGVMGTTLEAVGSFGKALTDGVDKLGKWNRELFTANMRFAEFSGAMAQVQAQQEMREIFRSMERGERRAEAASYQTEGMDQLLEALAPIEDIAGMLKSYVSGFLSKTLAGILQPISDQVKEILDWFQGEASKKDQAELKEIGKQKLREVMFGGAWDERFGRPGIFNPNLGPGDFGDDWDVPMVGANAQ